MTIDELQMIHQVYEYIKTHSADDFLKWLPKETAQALSNAILEDHAHDYDKKKAALLKRN